MDGDRVADFLFLGVAILPPALFAAGYPAAALMLYCPLLFGACLAGSGPTEPSPGESDPQQ